MLEPWWGSGLAHGNEGGDVRKLAASHDPGVSEFRVVNVSKDGPLARAGVMVNDVLETFGGDGTRAVGAAKQREPEQDWTIDELLKEVNRADVTTLTFHRRFAADRCYTSGSVSREKWDFDVKNTDHKTGVSNVVKRVRRPSQPLNRPPQEPWGPVRSFLREQYLNHFGEKQKGPCERAGIQRGDIIWKARGGSGAGELSTSDVVLDGCVSTGASKDGKKGSTHEPVVFPTGLRCEGTESGEKLRGDARKGWKMLKAAEEFKQEAPPQER